MILCTNHKPRIKETKNAIWDRVHLIPWTAEFIGAKADPEKLDKLKQEASGILAWAIRGCLEHQKTGLAPPESIKAATQEYRDEEDWFARFLADTVEIDSHGEVPAADMTLLYERWCQEQGEKQESPRVFNARMKERDFKQARPCKDGKKVTVWRGLKLHEDTTPADLLAANFDRQGAP